MLAELRIQNFAIIDRLELHLAPRFNVITGETGAGKSIIIDAVDMLLGSRADADFVRAGEERAVVEGVFKIPAGLQAELRTLLEAEGVELEQPDEILLTREIRANGRSASRINGTSVSLQFYRDVGDKLVDIHGQSEHLSLLKSKGHIYLLDRYANLMEPRRALADLVRKLNDVRAEISNLLLDEATIARRIDMLGYQIEEIRATAPEIGEEETLRDERTRLSNAEQLASLTQQAQAMLLGGEESRDGQSAAVDLLGQAALLLTKLARINSTFGESQGLAESLSVQVEELARTLRQYRERVEYSPSRLNEVEERLEALTRLKRKYGGTIEAVLAYREKAQKELNDITHSEERVAELCEQEDRLLHRIGDAATRLSAGRQSSAKVLGSGIESELQELRMGGARFEVSITQTEDSEAGCYMNGTRLAFDSTGADHVEFMMAANTGEPLRPMVKVASGGETARIMLSLKGVLSRADQTPTLIFDEIDQGIGGRVGITVGRKLWNLAELHQVLCVTHLAQLAGFGDTHFKVAKSVRGDRTLTTITPLEDDQRIDEIAEMLGSELVSARQNAQEILAYARKLKAGESPIPSQMAAASPDANADANANPAQAQQSAQSSQASDEQGVQKALL